MKQLVVTMLTTAALALGASGAMADGAKIFVIAAKADDPFWSKVKKGADDAGLVAKATGGSVTWLGPQKLRQPRPGRGQAYPHRAQPEARLPSSAQDCGTEAMDDAFKEVIAAKVPLIIYNSGGMDAAKRLGAMNYVGNDEYTAGLGGGEYFGSHGVKNVLCVNTLRAPRIPRPVARASRRIAKSGGKSNQLPLPSSSFATHAVAQAIKGRAFEDASVDGAITISCRRRQ